MSTLVEKRLADDRAAKDFADTVMAEFKINNIDAHIGLEQVLWMHHRMRALDIHHPSGKVYQVDFVNLVVSGDIQTAYYALLMVVPDDMTQPFHWLNAERIGWLIAKLKAFLGL